MNKKKKVMKKPLQRRKKIIACILTAIIIFSKIAIPSSARESYEVILEEDTGCVFISNKEHANEGDIVTIEVEVEASYNFQGVELLGLESRDIIAYEYSENIMWFEMPKESVVARAIGFDITSEIHTKDIQKSKGKSSGFISLEDYVINNASHELLGEVNDKVDISGYLSTMQTMAKLDDFPDLTKELTIENLFDTSLRKETPWVKNMIDNTLLFDLGLENEYYVAYIDVSQFTDNLEVLDYAFARNNTLAEMVEGCIFHKDSGLAYIPKELYHEWEDGTSGVRVQVLYLYEDEDMIVPVEIRNSINHYGINESGYVNLSLNDYITSIQLAEKDTKIIGDIFLAINGIPVNPKDYKYEAKTGTFIIDTPSLSISNMTILITESKATYSTILGEDWKEVEGISIELNQRPEVGELFKFETQRLMYYSNGVNENELGNYGHTYQATSSSSASWNDINDYFTAFYNGTVKLSSNGYSALSNTTQINSAWYPRNNQGNTYSKSTATSENNTIMIVNTEIELGIPILFYCTHLSNPSAYGGEVKDIDASINGDGYVAAGYVRGTVISTAGLSDGYIIMGFAHQTMYSQAGVCYARLKVDMPEVEEPISGGVSIEKRDLETGLNLGQGNTTFEGTEFTIYTENDDPVMVEGVLYSKGSAVKTIILEKGVAETENDLLPYGEYSVKETLAPEGYFGTDVTKLFTIKENGEVVKLHGGEAFYNQVKRGDIEFTKVEAETLYRMSGIPFSITSKTTGESYIIVTDENGYASTHSSWNQHGQNTNRGQEDIDGIWFGDISALDEEKGALIYDTYIIEELLAVNNANHEILPPFEITVSRDAYTVDLGTIINEVKVGFMDSYAYNGENKGRAYTWGEELHIIDKVFYTNVPKGVPLQMKGWLLNKETHEVVKYKDGTDVTGELDFISETGSGEVLVEFFVNTKEIDAKEAVDMVIFEYLYYDGNIIVEHTDIGSESQSVYTEEIEIITVARDGNDGDKIIPIGSRRSIIDEVRLNNLMVGREYTVQGVLMDKNTGNIFLSQGEEVRGELTFTAENVSQTVEIEYSFETSQLETDTVLVVFEELYSKGQLIASHTDLEDVNQTILLEKIKISTTASSVEYYSVGELIEIIDKVSYENLIPESTYTVEGILMDKTTGKAFVLDEEIVIEKDENGEIIGEVTVEEYARASTEFKAENSQGEIEVVFTFVTTEEMGDLHLVVFEELYDMEGALVAEHTDINDEDQTAYIKKVVDTPAVDIPETGDKVRIKIYYLLALLSFFGILFTVLRNKGIIKL